MLIQTNKAVSLLFQKNKLDNLNPILFKGESGTGRFTHIIQYLSKNLCPYGYGDCGCTTCQKVMSGKSVDILIFNGSESVSEFRDKSSQFVTTSPMEFPFKIFILRNINLYPKHTLDSFLKILEEPYPYLKIFATATNTRFMSRAILSRFHIYKFSALTKEQLHEIFINNKDLGVFSSVLDKYNFRTVSQVKWFRNFLFEDFKDQLGRGISSSKDIESSLEKFLSVIEDDKSVRREDVLEFFLEYYISSIFKEDMEIDTFQTHFPTVIKAHSYTLLKYLQYPNNYYYMNIKNQLFNFFNSVWSLRVMMKC